jgi:hypothetical protein
MSKPKYLYEIVPQETVLHADDGGCITLQQANLLGLKDPDAKIHLDRKNAEATRDALDRWLKETE